MVLIHVVEFTTYAMTVQQGVWNTSVEINGCTVRIWCHLPPHFHRLTLSCLSVPQVHGGKYLGDKTNKLRALFGHCTLGTHCKNWKFFKILMHKHTKWVKHFLGSDILVLLRWEIPWGGTQIKRATDLLILWENFGAKLFWHLRKKNFLISEVDFIVLPLHFPILVIFEGFVLLENDTASMGNQIPTFPGNVVSSSSRIQMSYKNTSKKFWLLNVTRLHIKLN